MTKKVATNWGVQVMKLTQARNFGMRWMIANYHPDRDAVTALGTVSINRMKKKSEFYRDKYKKYQFLS